MGLHQARGRGRAHRMREKFVLQNHPPAACLCLLTSLEPGDWLSITLTLAGHSPIATMPWEALAASPAPSAMARPILPPARQPGEQRWHSALTPAACGARRDGAEWHVAGPRTVHVYSRHWWPSDCTEAALGQKLVWPLAGLARHGRIQGRCGNAHSYDLGSSWSLGGCDSDVAPRGPRARHRQRYWHKSSTGTGPSSSKGLDSSFHSE